MFKNFKNFILSLAHLLWLISSGSSLLAHLSWLISPGSSLLAHHLWLIRFGSSPGLSVWCLLLAHQICLIRGMSQKWKCLLKLNCLTQRHETWYTNSLWLTDHFGYILILTSTLVLSPGLLSPYPAVLQRCNWDSRLD